METITLLLPLICSCITVCYRKWIIQWELRIQHGLLGTRSEMPPTLWRARFTHRCVSLCQMLICTQRSLVLCIACVLDWGVLKESVIIGAEQCKKSKYSVSLAKRRTVGEFIIHNDWMIFYVWIFYFYFQAAVQDRLNEQEGVPSVFNPPPARPLQVNTGDHRVYSYIVSRPQPRVSPYIHPCS